MGFDLPPLLLAAAALSAILILRSWSQTPANLPPFPGRPVPVLGHLLLLGAEVCEKLLAIRKRTGDIFSMYFGGTLTVQLKDSAAFLASKQFYEEIVREIGTNRCFTGQDRVELPYVNAVILETQRITHRCNKETTVAGYTIPKDVQILFHLDSVMLDDKIWGNAKIFRPERFL
ncbi:hypothetical protein RRG08_006473 [Elysia crispata]|uniref:Cytochrome P450 n=1 Tax=Elysia crispata TaxID=231223 RepID=A0AAE0YB17_9GAST|nr:hypothetical protein RRG08_006473 [Elysia crispata]